MTQRTSLRNAFNDMISQWRNGLPEHLKWDDGEPPANDINDARLRAKFYGAQYIIHRPFLHAALDYDSEPPQFQSPPNSNPGNAILAQPVPGTQTELPMTAADYENRRRETIKSAVTCIRAAIQSTIAFDGVLDHKRLVITNIMGTSHA